MQDRNLKTGRTIWEGGGAEENRNMTQLDGRMKSHKERKCSTC